MNLELNRRTFLAALGITAVAATAARRPATSGRAQLAGITPLHIPAAQNLQPPARPKTAAIIYLNVEL